MKRAALTLAFGLIAIAQPAHAGPQPTATEVFLLRSECGRLGDKTAEESRIPLEEGFIRHYSKYDDEKNRCYVLLDFYFFKSKEGQLYMYDGQGGRLLASWSKRLGIIGGNMNVSPDEAYGYIMKMMKDD